MMIRRNKVLMIVLTWVMVTTCANAQPAVMPRPMDAVFLMELAQRLADRGEYDEARGILDRLQRTDPDNKAVAELLEKINGQPQTAPTQVEPSDIAADISAIQSNIQRHERRNRDLEYLIRQLVQENDVLAQTLAKRNRDLLDLMKKVYGENAQLPELHIVTDVERTRQIMNDYQEQIVDRDRKMISRNEELAGIMQEIDELNDAIIKSKTAAKAPKSATRSSDEPLSELKKKSDSQADSQRRHETPPARRSNSKPSETSVSNETTKISLSDPMDTEAPKLTSTPEPVEPKSESQASENLPPAKRMNRASSQTAPSTPALHKTPLSMSEDTTAPKEAPAKSTEEPESVSPKMKATSNAARTMKSVSEVSIDPMLRHSNSAKTSATRETPQERPSFKPVRLPEPEDVAPTPTVPRAKIVETRKMKPVAEVSIDPMLRHSNSAKTSATAEAPQEQAPVKSAPASDVKITASQVPLTPPQGPVAETKVDAKSSQTVSTKDNEKLIADLKAKREFLIEKSMSVLKKSMELEQLQADIGKSSGAMKEMEAKYVGIIKDYDAKIQTLKESWAQDKTRQQEQIYALRDQLLTQTKEMAHLQNVISTQASLLEQHKEGLARKDQSIAHTDEAILAKDQELLKLRGLLKAQENMITLQKVKIGEQTALINFVDDKTADLRKRTIVIRQSLTDGDRTLLQLKARVAQLKTQVQGMTVIPVDNPAINLQISDLRKRLDQALREVRQKQAVIDELKSQMEEGQQAARQTPPAAIDESKLNEMQQRLEEAISGEQILRRQLDDAGRDVRAKEEEINDLRKALNESKGMAREKDAALAAQQAKIGDLENRLNDAHVTAQEAKAQLEEAHQKMDVLAENAESFKANAATASQRASELSEQVYNLEDRLQKATGDTAQEMRFLKETLAQRDKEVVAIKKEILAKDEELQYFYRRMADATKALKGQTLSQDQTTTAPSWASKNDINPASWEAAWDPKNNDAYALQQRLSISAKELADARQKLTQKESQVTQLEVKLKEKDAELKAQKEDYTKILAAEAAREESKKMRVRDQSMYAVELDRKLSKAREELNTITREVDGYKKNVGQLTEELKSKEKTVQSLNAQLESKNKELADYRQQITEKNSEIELVQQAVDHERQRFESLKKKLDDANRILKVSETSFAGKDLSIQDLESRLNNATLRERDYKAQVSELETHMKEAYKMVKQREERLNDLKSQLGTKENRIQTLQNEIERLKKLLRERSNDQKSSL